MNVNYLKIFCLAFIAQNSMLASAACNTNLTCLHYGVVNQNTCGCDCFVGYTGNYCEGLI